MQHTSIQMEYPIEIINVTSINPLISKCQIKVCWVGEEPNRNRSIITKETARKIANSLPGSPIVGFFNEKTQDFEGHKQELVIENGQMKFKDTTIPFGFIDLNTKIWFQKFLDDGEDEREYLVTEGYLWTGQYPETKRILEHGNNQSMELDEDIIDATWTKDNNGQPQFFIINEAIISKLCILGEEFEPCFEGANITAPTLQFSFDEGFKEQLFSMMNELKDLLNKGEEKQVFTRYAVEIGDSLWTALYGHVEDAYRIESVCEEEGQKFAVLNSEDKYYRLNFSISEEGEATFAEFVEEIEGYTPDEEPQFSLEAIAEYAKNKEKQGKEDEAGKANSEETSEGESEKEEKCPKCHKPKSECECGEEKEEEKAKKYSLDEIPEYVELQSRYSNLETEYNNLVKAKEELESTIAELSKFKAEKDEEAKKAMIDSFYMLSDEDKKEVVDNIDKYSIEDIEAKLSIICVRNKVSFNLEDDDKQPGEPTTYHLDGAGIDDSLPEWVKAALRVAQTMN